MNYQDDIKTELLILIPVLYFVGIGLKKSRLPDKWIPAVLGVVAVVLSAIWVMATTDASGIKEVASAVFTAVTQGGSRCRSQCTQISFIRKQRRRNENARNHLGTCRK